MRDMLAWVRKSDDTETPTEVDNAGLATALAEAVRRWSTGDSPLGGDAFVEKTSVQDSEGKWVGFNYYIVLGEPQRLGPMRVEVDGEPADLSASQAALMSRPTDGITHLGEAASPEDALYKLVWNLTLASVQKRAASKHRRLTIEPFALVPGKLHKAPIENAVMEKVEKNLMSRGYKKITWDRRDGRVVLSFSW